MSESKKYLTISVSLYVELKSRIKFLEEDLAKETDKRMLLESKCKELEENNRKLTRIVDAIMWGCYEYL